MTTISNNLDRQINKNIISKAEKENTLSNISLSTNISECKTLDLVIEAVPEKYDLKASIFKDLDKICNDNTIFASNTSSISISSLGEETNRPEKVIGMHFMSCLSWPGHLHLCIQLFVFFQLAGWPTRAIIARGSQWVPKDIVAISLSLSLSEASIQPRTSLRKFMKALQEFFYA